MVSSDSFYLCKSFDVVKIMLQALGMAVFHVLKSSLDS